MLIDVVDRNLPAIRVVTKFALRPVFPAMEVGVTILALIRSIGEVEIGMAVATCHDGMASTQRKASERVIEFDLASDHVPIVGRVTFIARNVEVSVRAAC